ncbi:MAG: hypothetical protein JWM68_5085 [Verrucomicrobiales bacterium]|nr:hypothetical protein [Verrucomicrobiales bacterium]
MVCVMAALIGCGKKHESKSGGYFGHEATEKYNDDLNKADVQTQPGIPQSSNAPAGTNQNK